MGQPFADRSEPEGVDQRQAGESLRVAEGEPAAPASPLQQLALSLAEKHAQAGLIVPSHGKAVGIDLTRRIDDYVDIFSQAVAYFRGTDVQKVALSIAAEWMLDNAYLLQQSVRQVKEDFPSRYYHELPKLAITDEDSLPPGTLVPRLFDITRAFIQHDSARVSIDRVERFLAAYQLLSPLRIGEVWAVPSMLRLGVLDVLARRLASLQQYEPNLEKHPLLIEISPEISDDDLVANCISSLRVLNTQDWNEFFESLNQVEQILREDPAEVYPAMDFETRDRYRKVVEEIARQTGQDEWQVANDVVSAAENALAISDTGQYSSAEVPGFLFPPQAHVGFYLLERGRAQVERNYRLNVPPRQRFHRFMITHPTQVYLGSTFLVSGVLLGMLLALCLAWGGTLWQLLLVFVLGLIPAVSVAVNVVNTLITHILPPRTPPRLDFSLGVPAESATLVTIPALLTTEGDAELLLQQIELHYLRNAGDHLYFGLLTDFMDAPAKEMPQDAALLDRVITGIERLNTKYPRPVSSPFLLLHRERRWNELENAWIGWERKRGKLHDLNRLILGDPAARFSRTAGDLSALRQVRFVITLDVDTVLPRGAAAELIGTLSHPLNRAVFNNSGRVVSGYTVLQPRTEILWSRRFRSLFTRVFAGDRGIDLYTRAVSDVYQDLFGEGIYIGKGIYDVAAFERSLDNRIPENALLSHDLFEGIQGRAGLVPDVAIIEDYPPNYLLAVHRTHRWIRGDWQLLPWLLSFVPSAGGDKAPNPLKLIDRWKILDNLRRSLLPPTLLAFFAGGWTILPVSPLVWTLAGILVYSIPTLVSIINVARQAISTRSMRTAYRQVWINLIRWFLALIFLPYDVLVNLDAVLTTLVRLFLKKRHFLQWTTAADAARRMGIFLTPLTAWRQMFSAPLLGLILLVLVAAVNPAALWAAGPVLFAWILSPQVAYWISRPVGWEEESLAPEEDQILRSVARQTWLYFEQFSGPEDHWLPPDHFQESPRGTVAHRTSPTNIGFGLLSTLSAWDLGYSELVDFVARTRATFDSLEEMEHYRGHLLNWYDTLTLKALQPRYISTVDSGNLAAALIAVQEGCLSLLEQPLIRSESWYGFADVITLISSQVKSWGDVSAQEDGRAMLKYLEGFHTYFQQLADETGTSWLNALQGLEGQQSSTAGSYNLEELYRRLMAFVEDHGEIIGSSQIHQLRITVQQLQKKKETLDRQVALLVPWFKSIEDPPDAVQQLFQQEKLRRLASNFLDTPPTAIRLNEVSNYLQKARELKDKAEETLGALGVDIQQREEAAGWLGVLVSAVESAAMSARVLETGLIELARQAEKLVHRMDFSFLFDPHRQVFHLGYNLDSDRLDNNHYDLLASEARIASFLAIAKGDVPQAHWMHLGRPVTRVQGSMTLLSWSATMFEYILPPLLMRSYPGTLLDTSARSAVDAQIQYARAHGVPWGISESGYYHFDNNQNYQYRAFGIPDLGYKRGLENDLVITPYASFMALPLRPKAVFENYLSLARLGMIGTYGLYEAVDFTRERLPAGEKYALVRSYMSHHQGMLLLGLVNYLKDGIMVKRFHNHPLVKSVELLLQEQVPSDAPVESPHAAHQRPAHLPERRVTTNPWKVRIRTPQPRPQLLSNGRMTVMITNAGGGFTRWRDVDVTRWRPDTTLDNWGTWIYLQDMDDLPEISSGRDGQGRGDSEQIPCERSYWSAAHLPGGREAGSSEVNVYPSRVEFHRKQGDLSTRMEVSVAPEEDVEIRRITITNHSDRPRRVRVTSFAEISLAPQPNDERHPAFNKLFVESSALPDLQALLFKRRPRQASEPPVLAAHALVLEFGFAQRFEYETDRAAFLGRGNTARRPHAVCRYSGPLSGTTGAVLDPAACLSTVVELPAHSSLKLAFLTLADDNEKSILATLQRYCHWYTIERALDQARSHTELELRRAGLTGNDIQTVQRLLSVLLYSHQALRAAPEVLSENSKGQSGLWGYSISGDYPVLLVRLHSQEHLGLAREVLQAYAYWRARQVKIDLVLLNCESATYGQALNNQLHRLIRRLKLDAWLNRRGGIFLLYAEQMAEPDAVLLQTVARAILDGKKGGLAEQVRKLRIAPVRLPRFMSVSEGGLLDSLTPPVERPKDLLFDNGIGGFSPDGKEYVVYLKDGEQTPLPWANVIAYPEFGFLVTEAGSSTTWALNSGENRLTPWSNDPVSDPSGEALYLRDEETAEVWSPAPQPAPGKAPYRIHHGAGYTEFYHNSHGLIQRLRMFASPDEPVKIIQLRVENLRDRPRRITATYFAEWVLGTNRSTTQPYIVTEYHDETQALLARNRYNQEFGERVAFAAAGRPLHGLTADRTEFLGRMGDYSTPAGMRRIGLAGVVMPGIDPCAALQLHLDLPPGGSEEVHFLIGQGDDREDSLRLISRFKDEQQVAEAWDRVAEYWDLLLGGLTVDTPDPALNLLLNRWLLYQALSCRIWGRSAFYQSSGAYGFRDQLQDVLSVLLTHPEIAREHILRAAAHQFEAGDVLHWWHPPSGRGVRTRISDDLIWLAYVTCEYAEKTGDLSILDEQIPFKKGALLEPEEEERYGQYASTTDTESLFEHCRRVLQRGVTSGPHGLPLIGTGDWNDGMNRVGVEGRGESVWLAWFLDVTLRRFARLCTQTGRHELAEQYRLQAAALVQAVEKHAWDGDWYRRAYYDDGSPLGSVQNVECQIDSLAQSWAVFSAAGDPERARRAMKSVSERLVRPEEALILLFTPPFDKTVRDPGYIRGYVPGIRENGGQYTHAAIWAVWAFALVEEGDAVWRLFNLINPIRHADQPEKMLQYRVEPYVVAADVYSQPPHTGRGGWTWYTGSSGWMYLLGTEAILGLQKRGDRLQLNPRIPSDWESFQVQYLHGDCLYHIQVFNPERVSGGVISVSLDGVIVDDQTIPLQCQKGAHHVIVTLGRGS